MRNKLVSIIPWALVLVGFIIAYSFIVGVGKTSRENNVYTRYTACVLSIKPSVRGDAQINACWDKVTKDADFYPKKYDTEGY